MQGTMYTSFELTHESLERLAKWFSTIDPPTDRDRNFEYRKIKGKLNNLILESKFIYSITLRYPTTAIDRSMINWMALNAMPTKDSLDEFYKTLGY